jgi:hypothetical protein
MRQASQEADCGAAQKTLAKGGRGSCNVQRLLHGLQKRPGDESLLFAVEAVRLQK